MATILFDISALQFHRTPPAAIMRVEEAAAGLAETQNEITHLPHAMRKNAPEYIRTLDQQFCISLAGVSEPMHIVDDSATRGRYDNVIVHAASSLQSDDLIPICPGLFVTTPERTLLDLCRNNPAGAVAAAMCEMCGLYTIVPSTARLDPILNSLTSEVRSEIVDASHHASSTRAVQLPNRRRVSTIAAFLDENGMRCDYSQYENTWIPCIGRSGVRTSLWKRPPLCSIESLLSCARANPNASGIRRFRKAIRYVVEGSGSPAETICALLMGPDRLLGQEGLPPIQLNRRVELDDVAAVALGRRACVVDISWPETETFKPDCCVEVDGAAFHDDSLIDPGKLRSTNTDSARRAALAHAGLEVVTVTWSQLADLSQWDVVVDLIYKKLGLKRHPPSKACLKRREQLHDELIKQAIN